MDPVAFPGLLWLVGEDSQRLLVQAPGEPQVEYTNLERIGGGATSKVYSGVAPDGARVALKVMAVDALMKRRQLAPPCWPPAGESTDPDAPPPPPPRPGAVTARTALDDLRDEIAVVAAVSHPSLVAYRAVIGNAKKVVVAMPLLPDPLLQRVPCAPELVYACEPMPLPLVCVRFHQLIGALDLLHRSGVAHFDISPDNIRLDETGRAVLCDLGNFKRLSHRHSGPYGAVAFSPPESVACKGAFDAAAADVWALGIVACTALAGHLPFELQAVPPGAASPDSIASRLEREIRGGRAIVPRAVLREGGDGSPWVPTPAGLDSLLRGLLEADPARRFTATRALQHPWWTVAGVLEPPAAAS